MRFAAIALVLLAGCISFDEGQTPDERTLEQFSRTVLPSLQQQCAACHVGPNDFLAGTTPAEVRQSLLDSDVVDLEQPTVSRLWLKGLHTGPAMNVHDVVLILDWLRAEQALRNPSL